MQITELSKEVFRLKEALGALSPPLGLTSSTSSPAHHINPGQQMALQNRISILTQQLQVGLGHAYILYHHPCHSKHDSYIFNDLLQDWERKHKHVVAVYRSHLLAAVQVSKKNFNLKPLLQEVKGIFICTLLVLTLAVVVPLVRANSV